MTSIVLVTGVILVACCVVWAVLAQTIVPDVCSEPTPPSNAGPIRCGD
jgi:hypothetical protein